MPRERRGQEVIWEREEERPREETEREGCRGFNIRPGRAEGGRRKSERERVEPRRVSGWFSKVERRSDWRWV